MRNTYRLIRLCILNAPVDHGPEITIADVKGFRIAEITIADVKGFICPECDEITKAGNENTEPAYQCSNCEGYRADGERRCDDCNLFMAKVTGHLCEECQGAILEDTTLAECSTCGEVARADDMDDAHVLDCMRDQIT